MTQTKYFNQAKLMLHILPHVAKEDCFALKGGTAINLFVRDMPRLSIDIDLAYLPIEGRKESLENIGQALERIAEAINSIYRVDLQKTRQSIGLTETITFTNKLLITSEEGIIKVEPNTVFRGSVFSPEKRTLVKTAQDKFELSVTVSALTEADLYGGKLCAALDRQHPRDIFDIKMLLENGGINSEIQRAFVVYLAGHNRPMHELLDPNFKDIQQEYESDFSGMTEMEVSCEDLIQCQKELPRLLRKRLSVSEKKFLISLKEGEPDWNLSDVKGVEELPALQWKLQNIQRYQSEDKNKWNNQLQKLKSILE